MDHEVYAYKLDETSTMKDPRWIAAIKQARAEFISVLGEHSKCLGRRNGSSFIAPLVCKQMYHEAVPVAWKTSIFCFKDDKCFSSFFHAPTARIDLISQLSLHVVFLRRNSSQNIPLNIFDWRHLLFDWTDALHD
jgi:hypothetical protein